MGRKKDDATQPQAAAAPEALSAGDRHEISAAAPEAPGADAAGEPAGGQPPGKPAAPGDGAHTGADGDVLLVADAKRDPDAGQNGDGDAEAMAASVGADGSETDVDVPDLPRFDAAALALSCAGLARYFAGGAILVDLRGVMFSNEEAGIMVDFVRVNPDAPLLAMYKHLELVKRLRPATPSAEDLLALTVFHAAASAAIAYERGLAAEATTPRPAAGGWPGERAFKPQEPAFTPSGFSPR